ncbi:putative protein K02A2.6 [Solea senegalensis]|uniref:Integrase catalytic domain-containing protein n=1 Tax=Solea senegalensis TaxID=28829 RepID=A0AAV6REA4_SOLSE|nr:uncharacterized protein K02A2.6-like [Solea senegalensis]KAG7503666.1 putative protein K02A2.6 [Solea senegalensis]
MLSVWQCNVQAASRCKTNQHVPHFTSGNGLHLHGNVFMWPLMGTNFLVVVDACSKWPEVFTMNPTTASQTITVLRDLFARTGVPEQLVSDNGPQFTSEDFHTFLKNNGIRHITSAPWHPATNGQAERNATLATTNQTPAMLFLGRHLRSRLDLLPPNKRRTVQGRQIRQAQRASDGKLQHFAIGQWY